MRSGKHLTLSERRVIHFFIKSGLKQYEIAKNIGVSPSTLSYELKNNRKSNGEYDPEYAQEKYLKRRTRSIKKSKFVKNLDLLIFTISGLQKYWSPEQISGKLKMLYKSDETMMISAEEIYLNIYVTAQKVWGFKKSQSLFSVALFLIIVECYYILRACHLNNLQKKCLIFYRSYLGL